MTPAPCGFGHTLQAKMVEKAAGIGDGRIAAVGVRCALGHCSVPTPTLAPSWPVCRARRAAVDASCLYPHIEFYPQYPSGNKRPVAKFG